MRKSGRTHSAVSFVIAATASGVPTGIQIVVDFSGDEAVVQEKVFNRGPQRFAAIGSPKAKRHVRSLPDMAIDLVDRVIKFDNQDVGAPINAVSLRADGVSWKRQEPGCPIPK